MEFSHPLARAAKVWPAKTRSGEAQRMLVVVTTLALDPKNRRYKKKMVGRLSRAAEKFVVESAETAGFMLINRLRDWDAPGS